MLLNILEGRGERNRNYGLLLVYLYLLAVGCHNNFEKLLLCNGSKPIKV